MSDTIDIFGQQLYSLNGEVLNYSEMGKRIVYAMQLSYYGIECRRVQQAVNQLFRCNLVLP